MPPSTAMRKSSLLSTTAGDPSSNNTRRTTASGRAIRNNTTRPANYYARPHAQQEPDTGADDSTPAGFFPALTFFTDAVTALPKEVMRQFTLMKEVEAKIHGPTERLGEVVDRLMQHPVPSRRGGSAGGQGGMMSFTAANSAMGSANVSLVNGVAPYGASGQNSVAGSQVGEEPTAQDSEEDMARRRQYHEMRMLTHNLLANLDEKNVVLTEANRVLSAQLARLDSVMPHVDSEIPEEARLGSMTHWAYSDNRQKSKPVQPAANERNRRDVAATNSLAAAASAIHETEIAAARREAGNSATREKQGKGKHREAIDSEFEDRPKKTTAKGAKGKAAGTPAGLGITTNGEPIKRRKVDKSAIPPAMERQISSTGKGKAARETPRSTPATETTKKATKAKAPPAPPKRKNIVSAQASPALASSPLHSSFNPASLEQSAGRPQSARLRQNSSTNLRQAMVSNEDLSRPVSSAGKPTTSKSTSRKRAREEPEEANEPTDGEQGDKNMDTDMKREDAEAQRPAPPSRSDSSHRNSGRQSKTGTPRSENNPNSDTAMARTRSTRSMRGNGETPNTESSQTPYPARSHKRNAHGSMSGLMKQIAPFNKSPDHHRGSGGDVDDPDESLDSQSDRDEGFGGRSGRRSGTGSRAVSRPTSSRKKSGGVDAGNDDTGPRPEDDEDTDMPNATDDQNIVSTMEGEGEGEGEGNSPPPPALTHSPSPSLSSEADNSPPPPEPLDPNPNAPVPRSPSAHSSQLEEDVDEVDEDDAGSPSPAAASPTPAPVADPDPEPEDDEEEEEPDPDDPNEPKYCYCLRGSYGDMVGCDNPKCEREWFHLGCTDLETMPGEEESWFCEMCRPRGRGNGGKGGRGTARSGRGRGR